MFVAVCDDEAAQRAYIGKLLAEYAEKNNCRAQISYYKNAESFLFDYEKNRFDILLLDIQMEGQNGMELARTLRKADENLVIIFITGFSDFVTEGYDVSALHYLLKPLDREKLFACLDKARTRILPEKSFLVLNSDGENVRIAFDSIAYIEALSHKTAVYTQDTVLKTSEPFGAVAARLSSDFIQCHRSYAVNLRAVNRIQKNDLVLDSGRTVPVSRRLYNSVNTAFIAFYRRAGI